jgi:hypothetical protein
VATLKVPITTLAGHCFHLTMPRDAPVRFLVIKIAREMHVEPGCLALFLGEQELNDKAHPTLTLWGALEDILLHNAPFDPALFESALFGQDHEHMRTAVATPRQLRRAENTDRRRPPQRLLRLLRHQRWNCHFAGRNSPLSGALARSDLLPVFG